jgi:hypothetical protein
MKSLVVPCGILFVMILPVALIFGFDRAFLSYQLVESQSVGNILMPNGERVCVHQKINDNGSTAERKTDLIACQIYDQVVTKKVFVGYTRMSRSPIYKIH